MYTHTHTHTICAATLSRPCLALWLGFKDWEAVRVESRNVRIYAWDARILNRTARKIDLSFRVFVVGNAGSLRANKVYIYCEFNYSRSQSASRDESDIQLKCGFNAKWMLNAVARNKLRIYAV